jgi:hypothetical protein
VTATNETPPQPPEPPAEGDDLVPVFLLNATRTSGGNGPGPVMVPRGEAGALTAARIAVAGDQPPQGWSGS